MNANYETKRNESHTVKNNNKTEDSKDGNRRRVRQGVREGEAWPCHTNMQNS